MSLASIPTVCGSLREALNSLENDHEFLLQGDVFNVDQLEGYMDLKWEEVYAVEHTPHPVEYGYIILFKVFRIFQGRKTNLTPYKVYVTFYC